MQEFQSAKAAIEIIISFIALLGPPKVRMLIPLVTAVIEYLKYVSLSVWANIRTNYKIAVMQDSGNGIILAATWLVPLLLIPRPWDYPDVPKLEESGSV